MDRKTAESLATAIDGEAFPIVPQSSEWCVGFTRADGKFLSIESCGAYLFRDENAYRKFMSGEDYDVCPIVDGAEWDRWMSYPCSTALAPLMGGESYQTGGYTMVIGLDRPDGKFAAITMDCAIVYGRRSDWEDGDYDCGEIIYDFYD